MALPQAEIPVSGRIISILLSLITFSVLAACISEFLIEHADRPHC